MRVAQIRHQLCNFAQRTIFPRRPVFPRLGRGLTWEFHFRDDEAGISPTISIDLDDQILPRDFVAELAQSPANRRWPQRGELFRTQLDLTFFAGVAAADLESKRRSLSLFSQTNVSSSGLVREISLRNRITPETVESRRQLFDEKFALNFTAVSRWVVHCNRTALLA